MENKFNLQLGDIIELVAPTNAVLHNKIFFIKYIDQTKLELLNKEQVLTLQIRENLELYEESIESINILNRSDTPSYALQNKLLPDTWISIYFSGSLPIIINGVITNLENDMIEIKTYPKNEIIYIDFGYKGIPQDLNIEKIKIIDSFDKSRETDKESDDPEYQSELSRSREQDIDYSTAIKEIIIEADAIEFGDEMEEIKQVINVSSDKIRYSIANQLDDLLDNMLSNIPNIDRSPTILNNIKLEIERFRQLRLNCSNLDNNNNVEAIKTFGDNYNPIIDNIHNLKHKLLWILPIVSNIKKLYDNEGDELDNILNLKSSDYLNELQKEVELWRSNQYSSEQNKYKLFINKLLENQNPFINPEFQDSKYIHNVSTNTDIDVIVENLDSLKNYGINEDSLDSKKFDITRYTTGLKMLESKITYFEQITNLINIDKNDELYLRSMLVLPDKVFHFSNINLPYTNIITRANNNANYLNYFKILNNKSFINRTIIDNRDGSNNDFYNTNSILFNDIYHFIPETYTIIQDDVEDLEESETDENSKKKLLSNYLNKLFPNTSVIFDQIKNYTKNTYNILSQFQYIQPFLLDSNNITSTNMMKLQNIIHNNIKNYKKQSHKNTKLINTNIVNFKNNNSFIKSLNEELITEIQELYNLNCTELSDAEFLSRIISVDNAKLFIIAYNKNLIIIIVSNLLNKLTKYSKKKISEIETPEGEATPEGDATPEDEATPSDNHQTNHN